MKLKPWYSIIPACSLLLFIAACSKKPGEGGGGDGGPVDTTEYTIKVSYPRVDVPLAITSETKMELHVSARDPQGKLLKEVNNKMRENKAWTETLLATEKGQEKNWRKLKVVFDRIEKEDDGKPRPAPKLVGRTVFAEHNGETVVFQPEDKQPLGAADEQILRAEFGGKRDQSGRGVLADSDFLPDKPVRAGQTWTPAAAGLAKLFKDSREMSLDASKATTTGRLVRTYQKNGKRFGVIEIDATFPFKDAPNAKPAEGSKMTVAVRYDGCIDGSACEANITATMEGALEATAPRGSFKMKLNATLKQSEAEKP